LQWDNTNYFWNLLGDAATFQQSQERIAIQRYARECAPEPVSPKQVSDAIEGSKYGSVRHLMIRMATEGQLKPVGRGLYTIHSVHNTHNTLSFVNVVNEDERGFENNNSTWPLEREGNYDMDGCKADDEPMEQQVTKEPLKQRDANGKNERVTV